ncbi:P2X purinoceptor 4-like [Littorina saxatilis]
MNDKELETCMFDPGHPRNKHCPVFKINTIVEETGHSFSSMVSEGGVIEIIIDWDCNFDCSDECLPTYSFHRLDRLENAPSRGFHLRYADHYADSTDQFFRTLYRAYGIRIIVSVHGSGRKFSKRVTAKTIGSGLSFFGIAAFIVSKGILRLYKMCCKRKCCLEDKYCTNTLQWCWTGCYDWCFCKPLDKSMRTEQDKNADDLRATTFVFRDALKTCSRRCVLSGERYSSEPEIDQSSTALDTTRQPINSQAGNDVIVRTNPAFGLPSDVENSL